MTQRSNLRLLIQVARKRSYTQKHDQNFPAMRAAETKRRRKAVSNLMQALTSAQPILKSKTRPAIWTPPH